MFLFKHTQTSVFGSYFVDMMWTFITLQMESEENDPKLVTSAAASCTNLEKLLQDLNVLSDCMDQLACMHHC